MICLTLCACVAPFAVRKWGRGRALESGQEHAELLRRVFGDALRELFVTQNLGPIHSFLSDRATEQCIPCPTISNVHLFLSPGFAQISCPGRIGAGPKIACDGQAVAVVGADRHPRYGVAAAVLFLEREAEAEREPPSIRTLRGRAR
jgi:hypothetical protein